MSATTKRLIIGGMTCPHCQARVQQALLGVPGVARAQVSYDRGTADVTLDPEKATLAALRAAIEGAGYRLLDAPERTSLLRAAGYLLLMAALFMLLQATGLLNRLAPGQLAQSGMGYGMLFLVGLMTSVHCVAMCGGISLSQSLPGGQAQAKSSTRQALTPALLYNAGRVISYTLTGLIFGTLSMLFGAGLDTSLSVLAQAALNRADAPEERCRFEGGWPDAERRVLCLEPEDCYPASPVCCVRLRCRALAGAQLPVHKDYLGSLMGLELRREALGDIVLPPEEPGTAYLFALEPAAALICQELRSVGRTEVTAQQLALDEVPEFAQAERRLQTATVSSLRLDAVLAAMLRCSRGMAAELVAAGRVEINHLPVSSAHAPVYESDVFTVRGKGRFRLTALPGKSKKDRQIIEFFQY